MRLRRLTCGKALPFRKAFQLCNLSLAGWKAQPSSPPERKRGVALAGKPEAFRKSGRQSRCVRQRDLVV